MTEEIRESVEKDQRKEEVKETEEWMPNQSFLDNMTEEIGNKGFNEYQIESKEDWDREGMEELKANIMCV